ncbi:bifunctional (p)ppGpp synthetase/guanosine-3',5'-bis(diphosphate) 3'-pyrophosphohydrolase [bacterium]|nr:MAG: bifunctional (p)ppGpp synthetase/guanosine-3',5'-bis(diphosphate) 3'-pyrophosphohydrolase [bacterium]
MTSADKALESLTKKLARREKEAVSDLVVRAFSFAEEACRKGGAPCSEAEVDHLLSVANILAEINMDEDTIAAGILHNAVGTAGVAAVREAFGGEVAAIAESFNKVISIKYSTPTTSSADHAEKFRRLILSMARDVRVVMVKLADHLYNMRNLDLADARQKELMARETLDIYAPLANRLGIHKIKSELEDLGLKFTEPEVYSDLVERSERLQSEMDSYIGEVKGLLDSILADYAIKGEVYGRLKHFYSIYNKMLDQKIPFEKVYDRVAFGVIVGELRDCYAVLGAVHGKWTPVPGRFKDYIAIPKPNLYQSLHTTVIGPRNIPMEVQIRTWEMHRFAEEGIAAHWRYKEKRSADARADSIFQWLRQIVELNSDVGDPKQFLENIKGDLFPDVVFVFTPAGEVLELPKGSTPVDFAYNVHSQVGNHCVGAKVNDRMVPLSTVLRNGDRVEIVTSKNQKPSADWLEFVKSGKAQSRIKQWIRNEQRLRSMELGREILDREFRKAQKSFPKALKEGLLDGVLERFGVNKADEIMEAVGYGKVNARLVLERVYPELEQQRLDEEPKRERKSSKKPRQGIVIKGVGDVMVRFAKCCMPLPGEEVAGFITKGQGVTVHRADCQNLARSDQSRFLDIEWDLGEGAHHAVRLRVIADGKASMLPAITQALAATGVQVVSANAFPHREGKSEYIFAIMVPTMDKVAKVITELKKLKGVDSVTRTGRG